MRGSDSIRETKRDERLCSGAAVFFTRGAPRIQGGGEPGRWGTRGVGNQGVGNQGGGEPGGGEPGGGEPGGGEPGGGEPGGGVPGGWGTRGWGTRGWGTRGWGTRGWGTRGWGTRGWEKGGGEPGGGEPGGSFSTVVSGQISAGWSGSRGSPAEEDIARDEARGELGEVGIQGVSSGAVGPGDPPV